MSADQTNLSRTTLSNFLLVARRRRQRHENRDRAQHSGDAREGYVGAPRRARVDDETEEIWHDNVHAVAGRARQSQRLGLAARRREALR